MKLLITKHEDNRRILTEWNKDIPMKRCKVIEVKEDDMILGSHYHLKNDSIFYLLKGDGTYSTYDIDENYDGDRSFKEGECLYVPRGVVHTFQLSKGSIMLEASSEPYDKTDEIQVIK